MALSKQEKAELLKLIEQDVQLPAAFRAKLFPGTGETDHRRLYEDAAVGLFQSSVSEGRILHANKRMARIFGYDDIDIFKSEFAIDQHYVQPARRAELVSALREHGAVNDFTAQFRRRDGSSLWLRINSRLHEREGVIEGTTEDVTAQMEARAAAAEGAARLQNIIETVPLGAHTYTLQPDGKLILTHANSAAEKILNLDHQPLLGLTIDQAWPPLIETEVPLNYTRVAATGGTWSDEQVSYQDEKIVGAFDVTAFQSAPGQVTALFWDTTERKRAQQQIEHEQLLLHTLMENIPDPIYFKDRESRFGRINQAQARLLGVADVQEAVGKSDADYFAADEAAWRRQDELRIMQSGQPQVGDVENIVMPDGAAKWYSVSKLPRYDADGNIAGTFGISRDITEIILNQMKLRDSERRFRAIFESEPECVKLVDGDGILLDMNPAGLAMLEVDDPREAIGQSIMNWILPEWHEPLLKRVQEVMHGIPFQAQFQILGSKGTPRWLDTHAVPLRNDNSEVVAMLAMTRDITEGKQSEEKLRAMAQMLELAPESITVHDAEGRYKYFNQRAYEMHGYTADEFQSITLHDLNVPSSRSLIAKRIRDLQKAGVSSFEVEHRRKDGSVFPMAVHSRLARWAGQDMILGVGTDITAVKRGEEERRQLQEQLRQAQKLEAIGTLAGGIAHDFNNILFAILGNADLLHESLPPDSAEQDFLAGITNGATRAAELVKQILTFARRSQRQRTELDIVPIIEEVGKLMRAALPANISIQQQIDPVSAVVTADPTEIHQVLMNICTNAGQAMLDQGGQLLISLRVERQVSQSEAEAEQPAALYILEVRDTGPGIPPEILNQIFDPFFTTKSVGEGTGMGLAVVHSIVQELNGSIQVESQPGEGALFRIWIPAATGSQMQELPETQELPTGVERVLVVDDERSLVKIISQMLSQLGYTVDSFTDSATALHNFLANPDRYDLAIMDQSMPQMTGFELARQFKALRPLLPVIICTGHSHTLTPEKAKASGISKFLYKPLSRNDLAQAVRAALDEAT